MSDKSSFRSRLQGFLSQDNRLTDSQKQKILDYLMDQKLNILVVGPTGAGKSSTINALFDTQQAVVGDWVGPMTMDVRQYDFGNLVLWDTPGLGDGVEEDKSHKKKIVYHLERKDENDEFIVDLVLVVLDGSSREMSTSFDLINNVVIPHLGKNPEKRVIVAINQADIAYKGPGGWDDETSTPTTLGYKFLDEKVLNVRQRINASTGIDVEPIYYCAGYQGADLVRPSFNLAKLLYRIVSLAPTEKRLIIRQNISKKTDSWEKSDGRKDYRKATRESMGFFGIVGSLLKGLFGIFG